MSLGRTLNNGNRRGDPANAPRCQARRKSDGGCCRQPAIRGRRVCRLHGGKGGGPRGRRHGAYRHGFRSLAMRDFLRRMTAQRRRMRAVLALVKANTAYAGATTVQRVVARAADGAAVTAVRMTVQARRRWRDGGVAACAAALRALPPVGRASEAARVHRGPPAAPSP